jgi:hypothetical protein
MDRDHHHSATISMESASEAADYGDDNVAFQVPERLADIANGGVCDRYELWSVQLLGDGLTLPDLDGACCSLDLSSKPQGPSRGGEMDRVTMSTAIQASTTGKEYVIQLPPQHKPNDHENDVHDSMRLIYPVKKTKRRSAVGSASDLSSDSDSGSDDDEGSDSDDQANGEFTHRPSMQKFVRHCTIISHHLPAEEPSSKDESLVNASIRKAYEPVPQRSGLKRRWVPFGGSQPPAAALRSLRGRSESAADSEDPHTTAPLPWNHSAAHKNDVDSSPTPLEKPAPVKSPPPPLSARQEAGQATAPKHPEPRSPASSPAPDRALEDKVGRKAAKKEAKNAAKEEKKKKKEKKANKRSKHEATL